MPQFINPYSSRQYINANSVPYTGAKLFVYLAGTSTKYTTTKDQAGTSNHANPIILNSRGEAADGAGASQAIWQTGGDKVKLVLAPSTDTDPPVSAISTWDNLQGVNDNTITQDQWVSGPAPTYISATSFTLIGDQTNAFHVGRRLRSTNTAGTIYSTITVSVYTTLTTVTVQNDAGVLDSGLSAVSYGLISSVNSSSVGLAAGNLFTGMNTYSLGIGPSYMQNISVDATVASKAITFSQLTKSGATPTATDKVQIEHRDPTITTGRTITRESTAATTLVVPSTATLGFSASETAYTHLYSIWSAAGGLELAVIKRSIINESELQSTTAISTASDSENVLYSTSARTGATARLIQRIRIQSGAVAGEWDNQPTEKAVWTPTIDKAATIIAETTGSVSSISVPSATFNAPVDAKVGDIVNVTLTLSCVRNGVDFFMSGSVRLTTATAVVESTGLTDGMMAYSVLGSATQGTQRINHVFSGMYRIITAGTITTVSTNNSTTVGTAPINQLSYLRVQILRPNT